MTNRVMAWFALAVLVGFLGILLWFVPRVDLGVVIGLTLLLALVDVWQTSGERASGGKKHKS